MRINGSKNANTTKMNFFRKKNLNTAALLGCAVFFALISCEEDLSEASKSKKKNFPSEIIYNAKLVRRDSGFVNLRLQAPVIEKYSLIDSPYVEAKKGLYLEYFDKKKSQIPGKIWAKYAKFNELKDFYEARGNVKILTNEGQTFATQKIYWDKKNRKMFTKDTVFVTDKDGSTLIGANGMVAKDDFSEYMFYNNSGSFPSKQIPAAGQ